MNKHAYLIIAHNQFEILKYLLKKLDFEYHDFYILIDKKCNFDKNEFNNIVKYSKIYWVNRINVYWGDYSQVEAEIILLKEAIKQQYSFYHLLSGVDLPLKSANTIYEYFEQNQDTQFIEVVNEPTDIFENRYKYYYFLQKYSSSKILSFVNRCIVYIQKIIHFNRIDTSYNYAKGANWFSITNQLAKYVINKENEIKRLFKFGLCVDEVFLQTLLLSSNDKFTYINNNLRFTIWDKEHVSSPKILTIEDYDYICQSDALFARKFNIEKSLDLIKKLYKESE